MVENFNKVLLAIDGSSESLEVVSYVSRTLSPLNSSVVLFHVLSKVPEVFWDLERDPAWLEKVETVREFEKKQEASMVRCIDECMDLFMRAGFPSERVISRVGRQQHGIARDIVAEAQKGYDVLVIGRGKLGSMKDMPLGGVASKILNAALSPAVWLVGATHLSSTKILIALDSSENSNQTIKHVGKILGNKNSSITLFHAVRGLSIAIDGLEEIFPESFRKRLLDDAQKEILPVMKLAKLWLTKRDIPAEQIHTLVVSGVASRASAILEEAQKGKFDTIVVGRRGISEVMDFSMGRVTNKLTQIAKNHAVWIVG